MTVSCRRGDGPCGGGAGKSRNSCSGFDAVYTAGNGRANANSATTAYRRGATVFAGRGWPESCRPECVCCPLPAAVCPASYTPAPSWLIMLNMRAVNACLRRWRLGKGAGLRRFGFAKTAVLETALTLWPLVCCREKMYSMSTYL